MPSSQQLPDDGGTSRPKSHKSQVKSDGTPVWLVLGGVAFVILAVVVAVAMFNGGADDAPAVDDAAEIGRVDRLESVLTVAGDPPKHGREVPGCLIV